MPACRLLFGIIIMSEMWWDVRRCWEINTHFRLWNGKVCSDSYVSMFFSGGGKGSDRTKHAKVRAQIRRTKEFSKILFLIP